MVLAAIMIGLVLGTLFFRKTALPEGSTGRNEPAVRTVKATVDGKPVHSYISNDRKGGQTNGKELY